MGQAPSVVNSDTGKESPQAPPIVNNDAGKESPAPPTVNNDNGEESPARPPILNCLTLFAKDLLITWADDNRFWQWVVLQESSGESVAGAELLNVCWLEVHGRFDTAKLSPGVMYEVVFVLMLKDPAYGWEIPVNFRLTLPDGSTQQRQEKLMEKPRGQWIEIPAGELKTSGHQNGEMEFSLYEYDGGKWKRGLLIKGVVIRPKL